MSGLQVGFSAVAQEARAPRHPARRRQPLDVAQHRRPGRADRKGRIAVGADADLAVYDTGVDFRIEATRLAHRNPISAYDGLRYGGRVVRTVVRGNAVDVERPDHGWGAADSAEEPNR